MTSSSQFGVSSGYFRSDVLGCLNGCDFLWTLRFWLVKLIYITKTAAICHQLLSLNKYPCWRWKYSQVWLTSWELGYVFETSVWIRWPQCSSFMFSSTTSLSLCHSTYFFAVCAHVPNPLCECVCVSQWVEPELLTWARYSREHGHLTGVCTTEENASSSSFSSTNC